MDFVVGQREREEENISRRNVRAKNDDLIVRTTMFLVNNEVVEVTQESEGVFDRFLEDWLEDENHNLASTSAQVSESNEVVMPQPLTISATVLPTNQIVQSVPQQYVIQPGRISSVGSLLGEGGYGAVYKVNWVSPFVVSSAVSLPPMPIEAAFKTSCQPPDNHRPSVLQHRSQLLHHVIGEDPSNSLANVFDHDSHDSISPQDRLNRLQSSRDSLKREIRKLNEFKCYGLNRNDFHPHIIKHYAVIEDFHALTFALPMTGVVLEYAKYGSLYSVIKTFNGRFVDDIVILNRTRRSIEQRSTQSLPTTVTPADSAVASGLTLQSVAWIPLALTVTWLEQILCGLSHIHSINNNQHKDIKPDNVLLREDMTVAICDFGATASIHSFNSNMGGQKRIYTEVYVAPERKEQSASGPISDMYGFGVLALGLLTQEQADKGMLNPAVMKTRYSIFIQLRLSQLRSQGPSPYADLIEAIYTQIIVPCIEYDKSKRLSSQQALDVLRGLKAQAPFNSIATMTEADIAAFLAIYQAPASIDVSFTALDISGTVPMEM